MVLKHPVLTDGPRMVWKKIKLHGTQTPAVRTTLAPKVWKKIKLHGTQTQSRHHSRFGRRKKLQGSQTDVERIKSFGSRRNYRVLKLHMVLEDVITSLTSKNQHLDFNVLRLWRRVNYRILKPHRRRHWFGRERNYMVLKPGRWTTGLEEDKIT